MFKKKIKNKINKKIFKNFTQLLTPPLPPIQDQQLIQIDIFHNAEYSGVYLYEVIYDLLIKIKYTANENSTLLFIIKLEI